MFVGGDCRLIKVGGEASFKILQPASFLYQLGPAILQGGWSTGQRWSWGSLARLPTKSLTPLPLTCPPHWQERAGEAAAFRGTHRINRLHGPALVGQAAVFSHYIPECRTRLHTGGWVHGWVGG